VRALEAETDATSSVARENSRLTALLDLRETLPSDAVAARITSADASGLFHTATLNKGERHGVAKGFAVVAAGGVVGKVVATSPHAARILLLDDHASGVDALVRRTRARGIVEGGSKAGCRLKYVKRREDIRVGDKVITSGLDGIFPKGLPVGEIVHLGEEEHGLYRTAEVRPAVDFSKLEEVLVVEPPNREVPPVPVAGQAEGGG
jgi:rod shape-determining protein MreC